MLRPLRSPSFATALWAALALGAGRPRRQSRRASRSRLASFRGPFQHAVSARRSANERARWLPWPRRPHAAGPARPSRRRASLDGLAAHARHNSDLAPADGATRTSRLPVRIACARSTSSRAASGRNYFQCSADVTGFVAGGGSLSGRYELSNAQFETFGTTYGQSRSRISAQHLRGGFVVLLIYTDPADRFPASSRCCRDARAVRQRRG